MIATYLLRNRPQAAVWVSDIILAAVMVAITLLGSIAEALARVNGIGETVTTGGHPVVANASWAVFLLPAAAALSLAWRRHHPAQVLAVALACVATYSMFRYENGTALLDVFIALYTVAALGSSRRALIAGGVTVVVLMAASGPPFNPFGPVGGAFFLIPGLVAAAMFFGMAVGSRRSQIRAMEERAVQAERTREEEAARRVDAERLRIARELHDAVAHTLSMINVQAGAAAHVAAEQPERAVEALNAIKAASKEGLREMRSILNVLRQADEADQPTQPAPGLAMLDALVGTACGAGLNTTVRIDGAPRRLPATVDLAAYRIIQESLTNAVRHAGPASATVALAWSDGWLAVDISDTGRGASANGDMTDGVGHGLVGMRERATAVGGTLEAGARPGGGFSVRATLPTEAPS